MNNWCLRISFSLLLLAVWSGTAQTFDDKWVFSANGQSVQPRPDGRIVIPNVSAPDLFGPAGPGSPPDFVSDDYVRVIGVRHEGGTNLYAYSQFFKIRQRESVAFGELTFTTVPPRKPDSILIIPEARVMTSLDQTNRLRVMAHYSDGTASDVTARTAWTTYRISNPSIANVSPDGEVTLTRRGKIMVTAVNEGASAVVGIDISPGDVLTTLVGTVVTTDGAVLGGATVTPIGSAAAPTFTAADGSFIISNVATAFGLSGIVAHKFDGVYLFGGTTNLTLVPGGLTDIGIIVVNGKCIGCPDADNDQLPDLIEAILGTSSVRSDSDSDGLTDLFEVTLAGTNPNNQDSNANEVNDSAEDFDSDGLTNQQEQALGTHPWLADTDGDGWNDETEVTTGSNPLSAASRPFRQVVAQPLVQVVLPAFAGSELPANTTVARPPVAVVLPSLSNPGLPANTFLGRPPVQVVLPTLADPNLPANATVARPPVNVKINP